MVDFGGWLQNSMMVYKNTLCHGFFNGTLQIQFQMCPAAEVWQHREDPFWRSLDRSGTVEISQTFDYLQVPQRCSGKVSFRCKGCKFELVRASALVLNTGRTSPVNETKSWSSEE